MVESVRRGVGLVAAVAAAWLCCAAPLAAKDYFLTVGGGYEPSGNQASLEKNVLFFQRLLLAHGPEGVPHDIFFADGNSPGRDLQYVDPQQEVPKAYRLLARLFGSENHLGEHYRSHEIASVAGAANRENLQRWFQETGSKLQSGDRLVVYVTAHGGRADDKKHPFNTKLMLWGSESISASELTGKISALPEGVSVVLVMVQCFSGGFSHVIFNDAESEKGVTARSICGFYATVEDRPAAGCTPDIDEENYQEYSSFFWAAIAGRTRADKTIDRPDYDGDGQVSFDEAHAYTVLTSHSIDIPVKTSDAYLRVYSKVPDKAEGELFTKETPYEAVLGRATPAERAVLEGLSQELSLTGSDRIAQARKKGEEIQTERNRLGEERKHKSDELEGHKHKLQAALKDRWPELANLLNPDVVTLLVQGGNELTATAEALPDYSDFDRLVREIDSIERERLDLDRRWAKHQRLLHTAENVALEVNLPLVAADRQERYAGLLAAERGTLGELTPVSTSAP